MSLNQIVGFILTFICVLLFASGISYWYVFVFLPSQNGTEIVQQPLVSYPVAYPQSVQNGLLLLTLTPSNFQQPSLFQVSAREGMKLRSSNLTAVSEKVSPNGAISTFVAYPSVAFAEEYGTPVDVMQVMITNEEGNIRPLTSSTSTPRKFSPAWSPDGQSIAFMASTSNSVISLGAPEVWDIFVTDLEGVEEKIGSGAYPQWSKDGTAIFVLKADGVYSIDVATGAEEIRYEHPTTLDWSASIATDRNQRYLSLAVPTEDSVRVFEIVENDLTLAKELPWGGNSIVFSPDGSVIAVLFKTPADTYPQLAFVNWRLDQTLEKLSLEGFSLGTLLLTDWTPNR